MFLQNTLYLIQSARVLVSSISLFCTLAYLYIVDALEISTAYLSLSIFLVTCAGFIFNDIYDYSKDKKANRNRPICSDQLSLSLSLFSAIIISSIALLIPLSFHLYEASIVIGLTILGILFYSPFSKKHSLFKGIYTSLLCCSPILYANVLASKSIPPVAYLAIILFITGREILLDIYDHNGDKKNNLRTIPVVFGLKNSIIASWLLMYSSTLVIFTISKSNSTILALTSISLFLLTICLRFPLKKQSLVINLTRIIMLLACISLAYL